MLVSGADMLNWARGLLQRIKSTATSAISGVRRFRDFFTKQKVRLSYFDEVLAVELGAINARRAKIGVEAVKKLEPKSSDDNRPATPSGKLPKPIVPDQTRDPWTKTKPPSPPSREPESSAPVTDPNAVRMRPRPIPCTAVGLALSGGGIRSAAFSLGALQALDYHRVIDRTDYLSTVSGGGYAGACMTACMSQNGGKFPFGGALDGHDNDLIGHLRNYSNYLMPRARSGLANALDAAAVLLRGLLANALIVATFILAAALLTSAAYPTWSDLSKGQFIPSVISVVPKFLAWIVNFLPGGLATMLSWVGENIGAFVQSIVDFAAGWIPTKLKAVVKWLFTPRFFFTGSLAVILSAGLVLWALLRSHSKLVERALRFKLVAWALRVSHFKDVVNDVDSGLLKRARWLLGLTILSALLDLQPIMILAVGEYYAAATTDGGALLFPAFLSPPVIVAAVAVAFFAQQLGAFLETSKLSAKGFVRFQRIIAKVALIGAGLVLPLALFAIYWLLSVFLIGIGDGPVQPTSAEAARLWKQLAIALPIMAVIMWALEANAYSLHQFYKDRLSKAFLVDPEFSPPKDPPDLLGFKLSHIRVENCPYHIINAAMNVQGSTEANRRGRNAEFFTFTPDFVGSDLTHYAVTSLKADERHMENADQRLDLGAAMAISGAAVSANMGSNTVRWLSPTLALLNVRLGYWLRNPRDRTKQSRFCAFSMVRWSFGTAYSANFTYF